MKLNKITLFIGAATLIILGLLSPVSNEFGVGGLILMWIGLSIEK